MRLRYSAAVLASAALAMLASCAPRPQHSAALDAAVATYLRGSLDSASVLFRQVVRNEPKNLDAQVWLADSYRRQSQQDSAVALARAVLANQPGHGFAHFVLAAAYDPIKSGWEKADRDSSVAHYTLAAHAVPPEADGWIGLWLYNSIAGDTTKVHEALKGMRDAGFFTPAASAWGQWLLQGLPPNAVLLTNGDMDTFPPMAEQVKGTRPDVVVVNYSLLNIGEYARSLHRLYGLPVPPEVASGAADTVRAIRVGSEVLPVADVIVQLWKKQAMSAAFPRPLFAAITLQSALLTSDPAVTRNFAGPRYRVGAAADSTADAEALGASVRSIQPAEFAGHVASASDRSPVRSRWSDSLPLNVANVVRKYAEHSLDRGDEVAARAALEKLEGLRRSAVLGDSLQSAIDELRAQMPPAGH